MRSPFRHTSPRLVALGATVALLAACSSSTKEAAPVSTPSVYASPYASELGMGISYLQTRAAELVEATQQLVDACEARSLEQAQAAYFEARAPYEEIQVVAPAFPELDRRIDARTEEFPSGELDAEFRGFHRIEIFLFSREKTQPALKYAKELLEDVEALQAALDDRSRYGASMSFEAMIDRCSEVASSMITSAEEPWSNQSLIAIRHAWIGIHSQYRHYSGRVRAEDTQLAERLNRAYRQGLELIAKDFPIGSTVGTPYSLIDFRKRREIADASIRLRGYLVKAQEALDLVDA